LVVDAAAQGMTLECQRCGKPTPVPSIPVHSEMSSAEESRVADIRRQLRENESQRTEITTYINQLSIQLHRWQLRLQTLNERKRDLENQLKKSD
jgi:outer membrane lipopolysaccharide assembly protein LptE/RlpB